jgi:hypothetical protein
MDDVRQDFDVSFLLCQTRESSKSIKTVGVGGGSQKDYIPIGLINKLRIESAESLIHEFL